MNKSRKYRLAHPERVREAKHKWYLKNREKLNEKRKQRYLLNKEKENAQARDWYSTNRDYRKSYTKKYREVHKELFAKYKDEERFGGNKQAVFDRDINQCQLCGVKESRNKKPLLIHHIDGSGDHGEKTNNSMENLITLCNRCHQHTHRHQKATGYVCQSREDIVRTMAKVIEEYRKVFPIPRNWKR